MASVCPGSRVGCRIAVASSAAARQRSSKVTSGGEAPVFESPAPPTTLEAAVAHGHAVGRDAELRVNPAVPLPLVIGPILAVAEIFALAEAVIGRTPFPSNAANRAFRRNRREQVRSGLQQLVAPDARFTEGDAPALDPAVAELDRHAHALFGPSPTICACRAGCHAADAWTAGAGGRAIISAATSNAPVSTRRRIRRAWTFGDMASPWPT